MRLSGVFMSAESLHCCKHFSCTNLLVPVHKHGFINLLSLFAGSKQIRRRSQTYYINIY